MRTSRVTMSRMFLTAGLALLPALAHAADFSQWRGAADRNGVSTETGLPDRFDEISGKPDGTPLQNVKWVARLGGSAYGSIVVSGGKVLIGGSMNYRSSAALWCFQESDGKLLWRMRSPFRTNLINTTWGLCSTPTVDGDRVYVLGHNGEVLCLDANGLTGRAPSPADLELIMTDRRCLDRNKLDPDGRRLTELSAGTPQAPEPTDAHVLWQFDLIREVKCWPHNAQSASILIRGDRLYIATGSTLSEFGKDGSKYWIDRWKSKYGKSSYDSPSLIVLDKYTGKLLAVDKEGIFEHTFHGAHSSPALGVVGGKELLFYGGGDGSCYAFDQVFFPGEAGAPGVLKRVWKFDCLAPNTYGPDYTGPRLKRAEVLSSPVFYRNRIYVSLGNDPKSSGRSAEGGRLLCLDATQTGDITATGKIWSFDTIKSSCTTVSVADGLLYTADASGRIYCLDADTGALYWQHQADSVWSSPLVADGKVYVTTQGGLLVFAAGKHKTLLSQAKSQEKEGMVASPAAANGAIYVASDKLLYALQAGKTATLDKQTNPSPLESEGLRAPKPPESAWAGVLRIAVPVVCLAGIVWLIVWFRKRRKARQANRNDAGTP